MNILKGKINQEGEDNPTITLLYNPFGVTITCVRTGQGVYEITSDTPIFVNDMPVEYHLANNTGDRYSISQDTQTKVTVCSFDAAGEPEDNRLSHNLFEINI